MPNSAFPEYPDLRSGIETDLVAVDRDELGDSEPGADRACEHRAVATAFPAVWGCRVDLREGFGRGEERHDPSIEPFGGDAEHSGDHGGVLGVA
jgi:hypothetical protein